MGLQSSVTAITFVALGTSLPDTFASKASAVNEPTADNSLGNITGSNGVRGRVRAQSPQPYPYPYPYP